MSARLHDKITHIMELFRPAWQTPLFCWARSVRLSTAHVEFTHGRQKIHSDKGMAWAHFVAQSLNLESTLHVATLRRQARVNQEAMQQPAPTHFQALGDCPPCPPPPKPAKAPKRSPTAMSLFRKEVIAGDKLAGYKINPCTREAWARVRELWDALPQETQLGYHERAGHQKAYHFRNSTAQSKKQLQLDWSATSAAPPLPPPCEPPPPLPPPPPQSIGDDEGLEMEGPLSLCVSATPPSHSQSLDAWNGAFGAVSVGTSQATESPSQARNDRPLSTSQLIIFLTGEHKPGCLPECLRNEGEKGNKNTIKRSAELFRKSCGFIGADRGTVPERVAYPLCCGAMCENRATTRQIRFNCEVQRRLTVSIHG